jgi:RNA recognition motif-containing protein
MYDAQGWNMMPMYPVSPIQPPHDTGDGYPRQHPRKPSAEHTEPSSPTSDPNQRAVHIQSLNTAITAADLKDLLQGAGTVEQCKVAVTGNFDNQTQAQPQSHGSAIMRSTEEAKRAVTILNNMTFMGAQIRVKVDQLSDTARSGNWEEAMATPEDTNVSGNDQRGQDAPSKKTFDPHKPLVVDGSGMQKRSLELLSTSAPT